MSYENIDPSILITVPMFATLYTAGLFMVCLLIKGIIEDYKAEIGFDYLTIETIECDLSLMHKQYMAWDANIQNRVDVLFKDWAYEEIV